MAETTKKRVVRRSAGKRAEAGSFKFTREMVPDLSNGKAQPDFLTGYRDSAWQAFERLALPHTKEEAWRRTDIRKLNTELFTLPTGGEDLPTVPEALLQPLAGDEHGGQITLTAGKSEVFLDDAVAAKGVVFTDLRTAASEHPDVLEKVLGKLVSVDEDKFAAMTAALSGNGVLLYVPKGVAVQAPLHSVLWAPGAGLAHFSHVLVYIEEQASATFVHEYASPDEDEQTLHGGIVEIHVDKAANFTFVELQSFGDKVWNFTHERANVERDATFNWIYGAVGSQLTKNFSEVNLVGEGSTAKWSGFYFTDEKQHLDHDTQQNHMAAHTTSDLLFKGALEDESRSVWQGMIYVAPDAQKTDGYQHNPNLVLSRDARADSIPGLEIMADDVRCTHGSTVGKIDETELFYLKSRGIPQKEAERLIVEGFFDPVMQRIPFERVRERLQQSIVDKLK